METIFFEIFKFIRSIAKATTHLNDVIKILSTLISISVIIPFPSLFVHKLKSRQLLPQTVKPRAFGSLFQGLIAFGIGTVLVRLKIFVDAVVAEDEFAFVAQNWIPHDCGLLPNITTAIEI